MSAALSPSSDNSPNSTNSPPAPVEKKKSMGFKHMFAGSVAGMASKTILQPLDLVKVRLQVQDGKSANEYRGIRHGLQSILKQDGFFGLYRGLVPNLMASGVSWGVYFFSYNHAKQFWRNHIADSRVNLPGIPESATPSSIGDSATAPAEGSAPVPVTNSSQKLTPFANLCCAAISGMLATTCTNPISMVKTRLQLQGKEINTSGRVYKGVFDAFTRIIREEGFLTLYRGLGPSLVLTTNGAIQFMSYEELKSLAVHHLVNGDEHQLTHHHYLLMGGLSKLISSTVTYPMAVTRSRLYQRKPDALLENKPTSSTTTTSSPSTSSPSSSSSSSVSKIASAKHADAKYNNMFDVIRSISSQEGWRGFYRGLAPQLIKTAPSSAITFLVYETTVKLLNANEKAAEAKENKKSFL